MTTFEDDIVNGNTFSIGQKLSAQPNLANCTLKRTEPCYSNRGLGIKWTESPLNYAARKGQAETVKVLLLYGADYNHLSSRRRDTFGGIIESDGSPLFWACSSGARDTVAVAKLLLEAGANYNFPCITRDRNGYIKYQYLYSVLHSISDDAIRIKRLLFAYGFDPNSIVCFHENAMRSHLHWAIRRGCVEEMKMLVRAGASANNQATTPFPLEVAMTACNGNVSKLTKMCDILLCAGADINVRCDGGMTVLHHAVARFEQFYRVLVKIGADELATDDQGNTPLQMCCRDFMFHKKIPCIVDATVNQAVFQARNFWVGWYPFQLVALCASGSPRDEKVTLNASFLLLHADPSVCAFSSLYH